MAEQNGSSDHIHLFLGMRPTQSLSDLMQDVKGNPPIRINEQNPVREKVQRAERLWRLFYSKETAPNDFTCIINQEHSKTTFSR